MYICVCIYVCNYVYMYVHVYRYVCMYLCMYVRLYVCMHVCTFVIVCVSIVSFHFLILISLEYYSNRRVVSMLLPCARTKFLFGRKSHDNQRPITLYFLKVRSPRQQVAPLPKSHYER